MYSIVSMPVLHRNLFMVPSFLIICLYLYNFNDFSIKKRTVLINFNPMMNGSDSWGDTLDIFQPRRHFYAEENLIQNDSFTSLVASENIIATAVKKVLQ